ncbi:MAG: hypothetical protein SFU86_24540 [Pirellulaceae bacterium]|nr:hypothetical protein [Pirellulaceae bacterium]
MTPLPFDPYEQWLGIAPRERPIDHYRLLGLPRFETDLAKIATAADERMGVVRSAQTGKRGLDAQRILNELSTAKVCLLSPAAKRAYDLTLQLATPAPSPAPSPQAYWPPPQYPALPPQPAAPSYYPPQPNWNAVPPPVPPPTIAPRLAEVRAVPSRVVPLSSPVDNAPAADEALPGVPLWRRLLVPGIAAVLLAVSAVASWQIYRRLTSPSAIAEPSPVELPAEAPPAEEPPPPPDLLRQDASGGVAFPLAQASLGGLVTLRDDELAGWDSAEARAQWPFQVTQPGFFRLELEYATSQQTAAGELEATIGQQRKLCELRPSGGLDRFLIDTYPIAIRASGRHTLTLRPTRQPGGDWLVIRSVRLIPVGGASLRP